MLSPVTTATVDVAAAGVTVVAVDVVVVLVALGTSSIAATRRSIASNCHLEARVTTRSTLDATRTPPRRVVEKRAQVVSIVVGRVPFGVVGRRQHRHLVSIDGVVEEVVLDASGDVGSALMRIGRRLVPKALEHRHRPAPLLQPHAPKLREMRVRHTHVSLIALHVSALCQSSARQIAHARGRRRLELGGGRRIAHSGQRRVPEMHCRPIEELCARACVTIMHSTLRRAHAYLAEIDLRYCTNRIEICCRTVCDCEVMLLTRHNHAHTTYQSYLVKYPRSASSTFADLCRRSNDMAHAQHSP
jgi:hypothetical protein